MAKDINLLSGFSDLGVWNPMHLTMGKGHTILGLIDWYYNGDRGALDSRNILVRCLHSLMVQSISEVSLRILGVGSPHKITSGQLMLVERVIGIR